MKIARIAVLVCDAAAVLENARNRMNESEDRDIDALASIDCVLDFLWRAKSEMREEDPGGEE